MKYRIGHREGSNLHGGETADAQLHLSTYALGSGILDGGLRCFQQVVRFDEDGVQNGGDLALNRAPLCERAGDEVVPAAKTCWGCETHHRSARERRQERFHLHDFGFSGGTLACRELKTCRQSMVIAEQTSTRQSTFHSQISLGFRRKAPSSQPA